VQTRPPYVSALLTHVASHAVVQHDGKRLHVIVTM
jgi:hypothetical protein